MAGLIQQAQTGAPAQGQPQQPSGAGGQSITPDALRAKMNIPANLQQPYLAAVTAGRKMLYSPQMAPHIKQLLAEPGGVDVKLAQGVAFIVATIYQETNKTLPPQLLVPVGVELIAQAADLLRKAGQQVTDQDIASAVKQYIQLIFQKMGISGQQIQQALTQQQAMGDPNTLGQNSSAPPPGAMPDQAPGAGGQ